MTMTVRSPLDSAQLGKHPFLAEAKNFSLDATHNTTVFKNDLLYALVIRHAETGTGSPIAFFFTTDRSFLACKSLVLPFKTFCQSLS